MNAAIRDSRSFLQKTSSELQTRYKKQSVDLMVVMLGKRLFEYWTRWRNVTKHYKLNLQTKFKDRIIALYKARLLSYLDLWKVQKDAVKMRKMKKIMIQKEMGSDQLREEVVQYQK